ncbi:MAG TPA: hypothetical protein VNZ06_01600 [Steroidobacteraceae bacterium]|jgi:hypothetical protein|nr:hypothetical protein [Steroidobacteraceae bacterium]
MLALAAWAAAFAAACLSGLGLIAGIAWALLIAAALAWLRWTWLLRLAVCVGAVAVWHWPLVLALLLAVPRAPLLLPGLVSSTLASWRHPRERWS